MSEKIRPGDLVMVVKPGQCCGAMGAIGEIHQVTSVCDVTGRCNSCARDFSGMAAEFETGEFYPVRELKRIPPLDGEDVAVKENKVAV